MTQTSKKQGKIKWSFLGCSLSFSRSQYIFPDRTILQLCRSGPEGLMLLVAAEVAPAMIAVDVLFAVEMLSSLKASGEEVAGWEAAAEAVPTSLQVGRKIFRDHCSSGTRVQTGETLPYWGSFLSSHMLRHFYTFSSLFACVYVYVHERAGRREGLWWFLAQSLT